MNTTFFLSGGAGRIITAIPALEKFARLNPNDDFKVIVHGWENLYWNHPLLQQKTYGIQTKGLFDLVIKNSTLKSPEPYHLHSYYNQKKNLVEAFDEEINCTNDHSDLTKPNLFLHSNEIYSANKLILDAKKNLNKNKFIVFQPFGSSMTNIDNNYIDNTGRSLSVLQALELGKILSRDSVVLYFGPNEIIPDNIDFMLTTKNLSGIDLRFFMAMICLCDTFVGVDSVGQHIARSFDKPGLVIMGSTFEKNVSYAQFFKFFRNNKKPSYIPIRISEIESDFANRINDGIMHFSKNELIKISEIVSSLQLSAWQPNPWSQIQNQTMFHNPHAHEKIII